VAYGGHDNKITLWMVKNITSQPSALSAPTIFQQSDRQETRSNSSLPSFLDVSTFKFDCLFPLFTALLQADATGDGFIIEDTYDDPYNNFFQVKLMFFFHPRAQTLTTSTCSLRTNLFHRHPISPPCLQLAASGMSSLGVAHCQTSLFRDNAPSVVFSVVVLAQIRH
jgi:hypothetical protein